MGGVNSVITLDLGTIEYYDSGSNQFMYEEGGIVRFEYSLKVVYDWEAKWLKPFLKGGLTNEEMVDFYKMMALDPMDERFLTDGVMMKLSEYVSNTPTATTFSSPGSQNGNQTSRGTKVYTAEEIYALMFSAQISLEFENRNLNRLLTILRIIATYNEEPKKMSQEDIMRQNRELNAQRRAQLKSKG